jgi:hypothetical protein
LPVLAASPYTVIIVVDRRFGERLAQIETGVPVWIVDTPENRAVVQSRWEPPPSRSHLTGITTFTDLTSASPEELLLAEFSTIDLHHGSYSANPPYSRVEVIGTALSDRVAEELRSYGFDEFRAGPGGFTAERTI